jgi:threonine/homoserine/homoserine lactone efflux protein
MTNYFPLWGFIILMVSTPGPANLLLMSAGAQRGFQRTLPFLSGLVMGKLALNVAMALGFMTVLLNSPRLLTTLAWISAGYMAYLALRQWTPPPDSARTSNAMGFLQGLVVHPLSPKTWMMTTLAFSQFAPGFPTEIERLVVVPLSFLVFQVVFHSLWCLAGAALGRIITRSVLVHRGLILVTLVVIAWVLLL